MADHVVSSGDRVFLKTPDGLTLRCSFGLVQVELSAVTVGSILNVKPISDTSVSVMVEEKKRAEVAG